MTQQGQLFNPDDVNFRKAPPVPNIVEGARSYTGGNWSDAGLSQTQSRGAEGYTMYREHAKNMGQAATPETLKSYELMRHHIGAQFDHLTKPVEQGGAGIKVEVQAEDPYGSFEDMHRDVTENGRLKILATETTGGHDFFTNEENDRFRAVHDAYGHLATGRDFSRHGEEAAYLSHRQMFPEGAHAALQGELRSQNSYLNWGGNDFPDNVATNTADWMTKPDVRMPQKAPAPSQGRQQRLPGVR